MEKNTLLKKLSDIIGLTFSKEERQLLSEVAPAPVEVKADDVKEFKTAEGVSLFISGVTPEGKIDPTTASVYTDVAMITPAPDGKHKLDNGVEITVVSGKVTEVTEPTVPAPAPAITEEELNKVVAQISAQETQLAELKALLTKTNEATVLLSTTVQKILDTPVNFQMNTETTKVKRTFDDLSPLERIQYNRGEITL